MSQAHTALITCTYLTVRLPIPTDCITAKWCHRSPV